MREEYEIIDLSADLLPLNAVKEKSSGARLVQICAVNTEEGYDLLYSFAHTYQFLTYKVPLKEEEEIVSISDIFPSASLYENEMRELYGVKVRHMKLNYKDKLYTIDAVTPFKSKKEDAPKPKFTPEEIEKMRQAVAAKKAAAAAKEENAEKEDKDNA